MILSEPEIGALIATLARVGGLAATAPMIGDQGVSLRARLTFVLVITAAIGLDHPLVSYADLPVVAIVELVIGLITGISARFVMAQVAVAGQLMGLSLGLGFASQYDLHAGESAGVLRMMITTIASLVFLGVGGLEAIVRSAAASPAEITQISFLGPLLVHHGTAALGQGLALAAPIALASFVGNIGLAVMNRAAPAVNVFSFALAAVLILGGLVALATATNLIGGISDVSRAAIAALSGH